MIYGASHACEEKNDIDFFIPKLFYQIRKMTAFDFAGHAIKFVDYNNRAFGMNSSHFAQYLYRVTNCAYNLV